MSIKTRIVQFFNMFTTDSVNYRPRERLDEKKPNKIEDIEYVIFNLENLNREKFDINDQATINNLYTLINTNLKNNWVEFNDLGEWKTTEILMDERLLAINNSTFHLLLVLRRNLFKIKLKILNDASDLKIDQYTILLSSLEKILTYLDKYLMSFLLEALINFNITNIIKAGSMFN